MDGCWGGRYLSIEVKTPEAYRAFDHGLSEAQVEWALRVLRADGIWMVTHGADHCVEMLNSASNDPAYRDNMIAHLLKIKDRNAAKWAKRHYKFKTDAESVRAKIRPEVFDRLAAKRAKQEENRQLDGRWKRRFKTGKVPIPFEVLLHGLSRKTLDTGD